MSNYRIPRTLIDKECENVDFNPYQYIPFMEIMEFKENRWVWNGKNVLIADEVGVGKTIETGIILKELLFMDENLTILIVCPPKLCKNWFEELSEKFGINVTNYYESKIMGQISIVPYSFFSFPQKAEDEKDFNNVLDEIDTYDVLILDEAHNLRNRGKKWKFIDKLIERDEKENNKIKIFMTGTPIFNSESDYDNLEELLIYKNQEYGKTNTLQSQANCYEKLLSIHFGNYNYKKRSVEYTDIACNEYEIQINKELYKIIDYTDELGNSVKKAKYGNLTGFLKRLSASSIYTLGKFVKNREDFFKCIDFELEMEFEEYEATDENLMELIKKWETESTDSKMQALINLLKHLEVKDDDNNNGFKCIVFSCFLSTCDYIKEKLEHEGYHVYLISGNTNSRKMNQQKEAFCKDHQKCILVCSDAAKEGHNLQICHYIIHYDMPFSPAVLGQRNGRIYRKGQDNDPEVFYMLMDSEDCDCYDQRLFGEIIAKKCEIIENSEKEEKVAFLNVLPGDAEKYIKKALKKYINGYFFDRLDPKKMGVKTEDIKVISAKEIAKRYLRNHFSQMIEIENKQKERKWKYSKAEEICKEFEKSDEQSQEYYIDKILNNLYFDEKNGVFNKGASGEDLKNMYIGMYNKLEKEIKTSFFGEDNCDKPVKELVKDYKNSFGA